MGPKSGQHHLGCTGDSLYPCVKMKLQIETATMTANKPPRDWLDLASTEMKGGDPQELNWHTPVEKRGWVKIIIKT